MHISRPLNSLILIMHLLTAHFPICLTDAAIMQIYLIYCTVGCIGLICKLTK